MGKLLYKRYENFLTQRKDMGMFNCTENVPSLSWRMILRYFGDDFAYDDWVSPSDLARLYYINRWTLLNHLKNLRSWGLITRRRRVPGSLGFEYQITEHGRKKLEYIRAKALEEACQTTKHTR